MVTAEQLRAARAILQMDQADLATISGVSVETIKRLERQTGKLQAKIETIAAIQKAFEAQHLEFLGDRDGRGAGVRLLHPDNLQLMREALTGELAHRVRQWLKSRCSTDPKFFERGEKRVTQALTSLSARILPTIVHSVLSDPQKCRWGNVTVATQSGADVERSREPTLVRRSVSDPTPMSPPERAMADAHHLTPDLTDALGGLLAHPKYAIVAKAYDNADVLSRITESTDDEIQSISNALVAAAPQWAKFRADIKAGRVRADLDVTDDLMEAVKQTADIRARGQKLQEFLVQEDAFDKLPVGVENWMRMFYDPFRKCTASAPRIAESMRFYVEEASIVTRVGPEVTPDEIQCRVLRLQCMKILEWWKKS
jgi:transcriptional regulator with XRE-family HTH domain